MIILTSMWIVPRYDEWQRDAICRWIIWSWIWSSVTERILRWVFLFPVRHWNNLLSMPRKWLKVSRNWQRPVAWSFWPRHTLTLWHPCLIPMNSRDKYSAMQLKWKSCSGRSRWRCEIVRWFIPIRSGSEWLPWDLNLCWLMGQSMCWGGRVRISFTRTWWIPGWNCYWKIPGWATTWPCVFQIIAGMNGLSRQINMPVG